MWISNLRSSMTQPPFAITGCFLFNHDWSQCQARLPANVRELQNLSIHSQNVLVFGESLKNAPTKFQVNPVSGPEKYRKRLRNHRLGNGGKSSQNLVMSREFYATVHFYLRLKIISMTWKLFALDEYYSAYPSQITYSAAIFSPK